MKNTRFRKLNGLHAGHSYVVTAPTSEIGGQMQWSLESESDKTQKLVVAENELTDKALWQPLG